MLWWRNSGKNLVVQAQAKVSCETLLDGQKMMLSPHLSLAEFIVTNHRDIDNTLPHELVDTAMNTADMVERIRSMLGNKPIIVSSGYRCLELNRVIGSADTSDHLKALAVDFICPGFGTAYEVAKHLSDKVDSLGIGQLIYEQTWVHCSTRKPSKDVNRILTMRNGKYTVGVTK